MCERRDAPVQTRATQPSVSTEAFTESFQKQNVHRALSCGNSLQCFRFSKQRNVCESEQLVLLKLTASTSIVKCVFCKSRNSVCVLWSKGGKRKKSVVVLSATVVCQCLNLLLLSTKSIGEGVT